MNNLRSNQRRRILKSGKIGFNGGGAIDAMVRNLSETGALLHVESILDIPNDFTLFIDADNFKRQCKIVWRNPTKIAVRFV
jgi:hypothetical protein